jgi:hypothetical protein
LRTDLLKKLLFTLLPPASASGKKERKIIAGSYPFAYLKQN